MVHAIKTFSFILIFSAAFTAQAQNVPITGALTKRLRETNLVNESEVIQRLALERKGLKSPKSFLTGDPYHPRTIKTPDSEDQMVEIRGIKNYKMLLNGKVKFPWQPIVQKWSQRMPASVRRGEVCAFKFTDANQHNYTLKTFSSADEAEAADYVVTHQYHCGGCSSLKDLAIYLDVRNLTTPAQKCSKKLMLKASKECYMETIGFSEACAETWAYNSRNTRENCSSTCMKDYGLMNIIRGDFPTNQNLPDGSLRPCLQCDELNSVPGWRYAAGRTRRGSGIISEIDRDPSEIYGVDYENYYKLFGLQH